MKFAEVECNGQQVHLAFGHQRLAIVDLDTRSEQPFQTQTSLTIFNGEIYNFRELAASLSGTPFHTEGDTELLSRWIDLKGVEGFEDLIGMWALAHWNFKNDTVTLARDFYGKKPLFIYHDENHFIASSNIRGIAQYLNRRFELERDFLESFLVSYGSFLSSSDSHLKGIRQVEAGTTFDFDLASWTCRPARILDRSTASSIDTSPTELFELVESAVLARLVSDREVGLFVSGGVDSSLILSILHKHDRIDELTCVIGDSPGSQDAIYAREVTKKLGVKPKIVPIDYGHFGFEQFLSICAHQERPFPISGNLVAMQQLYSMTANTDIKVVLDGTGADEIFGGYWDRYAPFAIRSAWSRKDIGWLTKFMLGSVFEPRRTRHALRVAKRGAQLPGDAGIATLIGQNETEFARFGLAFDPLAKITGTLADAQIKDIFQGRLQDWLWQNDRNAMANSIEGRSPFMDRRLFPFVALPDKQKFSGGFNKFLLRQTFNFVGGAPTQWRRKKQGFPYNPDTFLEKNRLKIIEYIDSSPLVTTYFPQLTSDALRREDTPNRLLAKLLAVAASSEGIAQ